MITITAYKNNSTADYYRNHKPTFCPNPKCRLHQPAYAVNSTFHRRGYMRTIRHGSVELFICPNCARSFSESSFRFSYYEKKQIDMQQLLNLADRNISLRQWSKKMGENVAVIKLRLAKLGCLLLEMLLKRKLHHQALDLQSRLQLMKYNGANSFELIRELIVSLVELLETPAVGEDSLRPFCSALVKEIVLNELRHSICRWRYLMFGNFYFLPLYQLE